MAPFFVAAACVGCGGEGNEMIENPPTEQGDSVRCLKPADSYFTYFATGSSYSDDSSISSYVYAYPSGLTVGISDALHVTGIVSTFSGIGISFGACVDASKFGGIEFDIGGEVGPTRSLTVVANTRGNNPEPPFTETGTCKPVDPAQPYRSCTDSYTTLGLTPTPSRASVPFSSFAGGQPHSGVDPRELLAFFLVFDWNDSQAQYPIDVTLGDMSFTPK